jgi:endonuclease/exonuclease/phosphatase family metal-dependent hydrolase
MKKTVSCALASLAALAACLWTSGCKPCTAPSPGRPAVAAKSSFPRPAKGEFTVMTFNLNQYALVDHAGHSDTLDPKPRADAAAIIDAIRLVAPDILAVQEMGAPAAWAEFKLALQAAGLAPFPYEEYLRCDPNDRNLALLARFPIVARNLHTNDTYTIGPTQFPLQRGILEADLQINPAYRLRLMVAHLKSKRFHEYGQAEMRRNEARLLCNYVRDSLKENPDLNLLVVGDLNDEPSSAAIREIVEYQDKTILHDLRPEDEAGAAWTFQGGDDNHHRLDYLLASAGLLPEVLLDKTFVVNLPALAKASNHRPLAGTFLAAERGPEAAPDLSSRKAIEFPLED